MYGHSRLRCLLFLSHVPGYQHRTVRKPPSGIRGWLQRREETLVHRIVPDTQFLSHVRGSRVATDDLLQAFLSHGQRLSIVFNPARRMEFEQWAANHRDVILHPADEVLESGLDKIAPEVWLDVIGSCIPAMRLRDQFSSRVYPVIGIQHGCSSSDLLYEKFLRIILKPHYECDSLVCSSRSCRKAVENIIRQLSSSFSEEFGIEVKFKGRTDVVPLCVDTDQLKPHDKLPLRKQLAIPTDAVVLLYLGYLSLMKADLVPLLPMIRRLVDVNPSAKLLFIVAGTGPDSYSKSLLEFVQNLGLTENVMLLRDVSDTRKQQLLQAADIFVAPSDSLEESFGLTPVEAMACGLPQVVANWDGYRDTVLDGETGFLIPTCWGRCDGDLRGIPNILGPLPDHMLLAESVVLDLAAMQDRLQQLIHQPELRAAMSQRSRSRAEAEFSYATVASRHDELWTELANIAQTLQPRPKKRRFDEPAYFDCFRHLAATELADEDFVSSGDSSLPISRLVRMVQAEVPMRAFDEPLLERLIQSASDRRSVGELIAANDEQTPDAVRRHILFLMKHGKLQRTAAAEAAPTLRTIAAASQ